MDKLKVLVVDDSAVYRNIITAAVDSTGMAEVTHTASNGGLALERLANGHHEVVLLDVNMPEMNGIEALKIIKQKFPEKFVIMISGTGGRNASITLQALEIGAMDFIVKPLEEDYEQNMKVVGQHLKSLFAQIKIKNFQKQNPVKASIPNQIPNQIKTKMNGVDLIVIGSSTGGPVALEKIFEKLTKNFHKPILVVQHMPPEFTSVLANSLNKKSELNIIEGKEDDIIRAGQAIIAPGGKHMVLKSRRQIGLADTGYVNGVRPSIDILFNSVAQEYSGARILAVILTGMGNDGMIGVQELKKKCSCYCITQNEESCVVYGMPRSVSEAGLSDEVLDITEIAKRIQMIADHGS